MLKWYLNGWRERRLLTWEAFRTAVRGEFEVAFPVLTVPRHDQRLTENIEYLLRFLADCGEQVVDVLHYADADQLPCPPLPAGSQFRSVTITFDEVDRAEFFPLKKD